VSAARPEIADYHFTTITPVLGVVSLGDAQNFVMADIPGLIEGASEGVGLGHDFLRHIERTKVIIHVLDASGIEGRDPVEDFYKINKELELYSAKLAKRHQVIAANKMDLPQSAENLKRIEEMAQKEGLEVYPVSAATKEGLGDLMRRVYQMLQDYVEEAEEENPEKIYKAEEDTDDDITIKRDMSGRGFVVSGKSLEKLVAMTNFANDEAIRRFQYIWRLKGIDEKLREKGIKEGDSVFIGEMEFEYKN
ncbi:MAG TPA: Obg family GTPase CgtA, partial [Megamonas hypermegale]|nr:Obg family GTPase CgtA [Megamonas hypermegale]